MSSSKATEIFFLGVCPFLTCLRTEPHSHPICPECGAVRYGNIFCAFCRDHWTSDLNDIV